MTFIELLLSGRNCSQYFIDIALFNPHEIPMRVSFYEWGNPGLENLCRVMHPVSSSVESRVIPSALVACLTSCVHSFQGTHKVKSLFTITRSHLPFFILIFSWMENGVFQRLYDIRYSNSLNLKIYCKVFSLQLIKIN